jgi:uncharacterized protein (TIGR03435 family)
MVQALLEDRFRLQIHHETREAPVYALTVAPGGPKLRQFAEGSCTPIDLTKPPAWPPAPRQCNFLLSWKLPNMIMSAQGASLDEFSKLLGLAFDRPVIDKTGIAGKFDFNLEFAPDATTPRFLPGGPAHPPAPPSDNPTAPSILTVVPERLGLQLEPARGPQEFLVIDHVERPYGNQ